MTTLGESGSKMSHFVPEPRNLAEATKFTAYVKKARLKATLKHIKNLTKNHTF